jgi:hypothetical protein
LLRRENELSPLRVKDHYAGCFRAVVDEDIRFAVNLDPGFVNGFEGNRPKWFLRYSFQDALSRHANSNAKDSYPRTAMQVITGRWFEQSSISVSWLPCGLVNQSLAFFVYLWVPEGSREKENNGGRGTRRIIGTP